MTNNSNKRSSISRLMDVSLGNMAIRCSRGEGQGRRYHTSAGCNGLQHCSIEHIKQPMTSSKQYSIIHCRLGERLSAHRICLGICGGALKF
jgi:hypothetical protein